MEIINGTPKTLVAADGMVLTQTATVDISARILTKRVYLAVNDDAARWREITAAEADAIRAEQQSERERMMEDI